MERQIGYIKYLFGIFVSIAVGITSGILFNTHFLYHYFALAIETLSSMLVIGSIFKKVSFFETPYNGCIKDELKYLFTGALFSFGFPVTSLTLAFDRPSLLNSVLYGLDIGSFALMLFGIVFLFNKYINKR